MTATITAADADANELFSSLMAGTSLTVPHFDVAAYTAPDATGPLYGTVNHLTNDDLTTKSVDGTGTFDVLMGGFKAFLEGEFKANRISGAEYTKAFIALTEGAMSNAVQFLLGRDQAYWQAMQAQIQAQTAQVGLVAAKVALESAKAQLILYETQAAAAQAEYALTKLKLATESAQHDLTQVNTQLAETNLDTAQYTLTNILPLQKTLVAEQGEVQRAQTMDVRSDGVTPINGSVGMQKKLYQQQITSYQRDAEVKAAKLFTDAWVTQKTMDEGLVPPNGFTNASVDTVLTALKTNNNLG